MKSLGNNKPIATVSICISASRVRRCFVAWSVMSTGIKVLLDLRPNTKGDIDLCYVDFRHCLAVLLIWEVDFK